MAWMQLSFKSHCLRREVPLEILLPADAEEGPRRGDFGYRTLYLLHGYGGNQSSYLLDAPVKALSEAYGLAVVLPAGENDFYLDREEDGARCGEYIGRELIAFTRSLLPELSHRREDTLIGGLSMGAYGALLCGLRYPETFGHVIVNSTSLCGFFQESADEASRLGRNRFRINRGFYELIFGPLDNIFESDRDPLVRVDELLRRGAPVPDLFFSVGCNDTLCFALRALMPELLRRGIPVEYREYPGTHEQAVFNRGLREALERLYGPVPPVRGSFWVDNEPLAPQGGMSWR